MWGNNKLDHSDNNNKFILDNRLISKATIVNKANERESKDSTTGTKVIFPVNKSGLVYGFMVYGYTGYAIKGYDIVSSAISILCYHTINTIKRYTNDVNEHSEDNAMLMFFMPNLKKNSGSDISKILLKSMVSSMFDIQGEYMDHIKVFIKYDS